MTSTTITTAQVTRLATTLISHIDSARSTAFTHAERMIAADQDGDIEEGQWLVEENDETVALQNALVLQSVLATLAGFGIQPEDWNAVGDIAETAANAVIDARGVHLG